MGLVQEQWVFLQDVAKLIQFIKDMGMTATGGELWRHEIMQAYYLKVGLSKAKRSKHQDRLAIDLNFIEGGKIIECPESVGKYWEVLNVKQNVWGGRWKMRDFSHFERR